MKNSKIMTTTMMIWALALIFNLNTAFADEKSTVFEMGESGQTVSFPMSAEEIAAAEAEIEKATVHRHADAEKKGTALVIYEVGDAGSKITFPLSLTGEAAEDMLGRKPDSRASAETAKPDYRVLTFEMAESGVRIEFPLAVKVIVIGDENTMASREGR